jgi:hypothetical protein
MTDENEDRGTIKVQRLLLPTQAGQKKVEYYRLPETSEPVFNIPNRSYRSGGTPVWKNYI